MTQNNLNFKVNQKIEVINHNERQKCNIQGVYDKFLVIDVVGLLNSDETVEYIVQYNDDIYKCKSKILGRKTENKVSLVVITKPDYIEKIQRREYYRLPISMVMGYCELADSRSKKGLYDIALDLQETMSMTHTIDISGGGIKIITNQYFNKNKKLILELNVPNTVYVVGMVVRSEKNGELKNYRTSLKFIDMDNSTRDKIIKFIFDRMREQMKYSE